MLVTGGSAQTAVDWWDAARGRCDPTALEGLWAAVPPPMRLSRFAESTAYQLPRRLCRAGVR